MQGKEEKGIKYSILKVPPFREGRRVNYGS